MQDDTSGTGDSLFGFLLSIDDFNRKWGPNDHGEREREFMRDLGAVIDNYYGQPPDWLLEYARPD